MPKAYLIFRKLHNSYSVHIKNLEKLSVAQIQLFQTFVESRNGIFDFNTYTFVIQKKLEFFEFVNLLKKLSIDAECEEYIPLIKTQPRIGFGQYKGMHLSDLPDSYLSWLQSNYHGKQKEDILKEINKRGYR